MHASFKRLETTPWLGKPPGMREPPVLCKASNTTSRSCEARVDDRGPSCHSSVDGRMDAATRLCQGRRLGAGKIEIRQEVPQPSLLEIAWR